MGFQRLSRRFGFFGKVIIPIVVVLPLASLANALYLRASSEDAMVDSSVRFAEATIGQFKILRSYYTENVVKKAKGALRVGTDHVGQADMIPLPATMIHDLSERFSEGETGLRLRLYSDHPFPNRRDRSLDGFSREAIAYLGKNPDGVLTRVVDEPGRESVRVAIADKMVAESCVQCHNTHPQSPFKQWKVGDVRGVLEVEVPTRAQVAAVKAMVNHSGGFGLGTTVFLLVVIGLTVYYRIAQPIRRIVGGLNGSVADTLARGASLAGASEEVSGACTEQASAIQETVSALEEIRAMSAKTVDGANSSSEMAKSSHRVAVEGKRSVEEMILAIGEIDSSNRAVVAQIEESNQRIGEVVKVIAEIGAKTQVINDIVFQTRLLSFNASVEAARAGENGKGFAVVAEEVGNLARMSGSAAQEISTLLAGSIQRVERIVDDTRARVEGLVGTGTAKVAAGNRIALRCGEILDQIVGNAVEAERMITEISGAAHEQSKGVTGIAEAMGQLDQATHRNVASAEKTSVISGELVGQAEALRSLVLSFATEALGETAARDSASGGAEIIPIRAAPAEAPADRLSRGRTGTEG